MTDAPQQQEPLSIIHIIGDCYISLKYIFNKSGTAGDEVATDFVKNHLSSLRLFCWIEIAVHYPATPLLEIIYQWYKEIKDFCIAFILTSSSCHFAKEISKHGRIPQGCDSCKSFRKGFILYSICFKKMLISYSEASSYHFINMDFSGLSKQDFSLCTFLNYCFSNTARCYLQDIYRTLPYCTFWPAPW